MSFQDVVLRAIERIAEDKRQDNDSEVPERFTYENPPTFGTVEHRWRLAFEQLQQIMGSGDDEVQLAILSNLNVFARAIRYERESASIPIGNTSDIVAKAEAAIADSDEAVAAADAVAGEHQRNLPHIGGDKRRNTRK